MTRVKSHAWPWRRRAWLVASGLGVPQWFVNFSGQTDHHTMLTLCAGLLVFLGVHSLQVLAPQWRLARQAQWGALVYKGVYAGVSALGLVLLVWGYGQARAEPVVFWTPPRGLLHLSFVLMWLSMVLLVAAYWPRNGLRQRLRHPMTLGVKVWALAHLLANGTLADLMLFGTFLIWSVLVFRSARHRPTADWPAASALATVGTVVLGTAVWAAFLWGGLHARWIGVSPLGSAG